MVYGYIRDFTTGQSVEDQADLLMKQYDTLTRANIFVDTITQGTEQTYPEYSALKSIIKQRDSLVVHGLNQLGQTNADIKNSLQWLLDNGIILNVLNLPTTLQDFPKGTDWLADMLTTLLLEVYGTLTSTEAHNEAKPRRRGLSPIKSDAIEEALRLYNTDNGMSVKEICELTGMSRESFYKYKRRREAGNRNKKM